MLHPVLLLFAFVECRDDSMKSDGVWNNFFYSAALSAISSSLQIYLLVKRGTIGEYEASYFSGFKRVIPVNTSWRTIPQQALMKPSSSLIPFTFEPKIILKEKINLYIWSGPRQLEPEWQPVSYLASILHDISGCASITVSEGFIVVGMPSPCTEGYQSQL